jgi:predicted nucleotide-binding protein
MEIGIGEIDAGREKGSLLARSNALAKYTIDHLDRPTAEGEPLAIAVVRHAAEFDETRLGIQLGGVTEEMRTFLRDAIRKNGLANDDLVAAQGRVLPPYTKAAVHETESISDSVEGAIMPRRKTGKVFIVHGREDGPKYEIAHFLTQIGLEPVILHERPNGGRTLISKFQEESGDIEFAVVLMTPDDSGGLAGGAQSPRARQNVIFELGFFIGKLGPAKVCALVAGAIEKPSDFEAVVYIEYGPKTSWKVELARELRHAGIQFDPNKVF